MKKYRLALERLRERQKIILVYQGEFGSVTAVRTTYLGCRPAPHYQGCPAGMIGVSVLHKPRGKRKSGYKTIPYNTPLIVYGGWRDIDADRLVFEPIGGGEREPVRHARRRLLRRSAGHLAGRRHILGHTGRAG